MDDTIKLITIEIAPDDLGIDKRTETAREVFCTVNSVQRTEFYSAYQQGLQPSFRFDIFAMDYNGERILEYSGIRYSVIRTYLRNLDTIELYAERKAGTV